MDKFKQILKRCRCGVYLTINSHMDSYKTVVESFEELDLLECLQEVSPNIRKRMIELDTIINLTFYPDTPIGSYDLYHYDLDAIFDEALECLGLI